MITYAYTIFVQICTEPRGVKGQCVFKYSQIVMSAEGTYKTHYIYSTSINHQYTIKMIYIPK